MANDATSIRCLGESSMVSKLTSASERTCSLNTKAGSFRNVDLVVTLAGAKMKTMRSSRVNGKPLFYVVLLCVHCALSNQAALEYSILDVRSFNDSATDADSVNGTLGAQFPKEPDFVSCSGSYGVELQVEPCRDALSQLSFPKINLPFARSTGHKYGYQVAIVPLTWTDNPGLSTSVVIL